MADPSVRTLRLLSLLQSHRHWTGGELADRLGVSARTLRRDVDRLRELGYPVQARPGTDGGYQLAAGAVLPPLVLDDEEAVSLVVGLLAAAQSGVAGTAEASVRALAKIVPVMPSRLRRQVADLHAMTEPVRLGEADPVDAGALTEVARACRDTERVRFGYTTAAGDRAERHVEPHRLVSLGRRWYLVAHDLDRHDWRSFRLDRLAAPTRTGQRFAPRPLPAADAAAFVRAGLVEPHGRREVVVEVALPAEQVRTRLGRWAAVTATGPGSCRVEMAAESLDWPAHALGALGAEFTVVSPPEMAAHLLAWAERFTRAAARATAEPTPAEPGTAQPGPGDPGATATSRTDQRPSSRSGSR